MLIQGEIYLTYLKSLLPIFSLARCSIAWEKLRTLWDSPSICFTSVCASSPVYSSTKAHREIPGRQQNNREVSYSLPSFSYVPLVV